MQVRIDDRELLAMDQDEGYVSKRYSTAIHRAFRKIMGLIRAASTPNDLRVFKGLRLEALQGKRAGQHSLRLNDQWRLIVRFEADNTIVIEIVDYH